MMSDTQGNKLSDSSREDTTVNTEQDNNSATQGGDNSSKEKQSNNESNTEETETDDVESQEFVISPETLEKLTLGFLSHCLPDLQKAKGALSEILTNQSVLHETVQNENSKFNLNEEIEQTMTKAKLYHSKLLYLRREMNNLTEKSFKLKKRGIKLQQQKIKEEIQRQEQEEKEKLREEMLTAKVAKKRTSSQSDKS